jgi:hypothetical protein
VSQLHPVRALIVLVCILISLCLCLAFPGGLSPSGFAAEILYAFLVCPMRSTYATYSIPFDLGTLIVSGKDSFIYDSDIFLRLSQPMVLPLLWKTRFPTHTELADVAVTFQICILGIVCSNLARDTGYSDFFRVIFLSRSRQMQGWYPDSATATSSHPFNLVLPFSPVQSRYC